MSTTGRPLVTVSLASHDGLRWLPACLDSVAAQTVDDLEVLVLDDASGDGSLDWLRERARRDPRMRVSASDSNLGYAAAQNINIAKARGDVVLLLNQDVVLDAGFLASALAVLHERPEVAAVQGRIRRLGPAGQHLAMLDTTGLLMHRDRHASIRGHGRDDAASAALFQAGPVWGADGPAPVIRRSALQGAALPRSRGGVEVLDEDFFMHKEDVDLAWRLRRLGWTAWYEPAALAWHARTGFGAASSAPSHVIAANMSNPPRVRGLSWRNQRLMQVKNDPLGDALRHLPWIFARELLELGFIVLRDRGRLRSVPSLLRALPWAMRKRAALGRAIRKRQSGLV